jgi:two-component system, OmpR family, sensor histidine kinase KdpD
VALVTGIGELASGAYVTPPHLSLMYLLAVLVTATRLGLWPALLASVLSVAALDYLFIPPIYEWDVDTPQDALLLVFLSIGAMIASGLAARLREQVSIAQRNAETTAALCRFAGKLAGTLTLEAAVSAVIDQFTLMLPHRAAIFLHGEPAGPAPLSFPLRSTSGSVGTLTVTPLSGVETTDEQRVVIGALAELAGIALERQVLADRLAQLSIEQVADRLRSALLNSIAHDLTAPIASVATALTSLSHNYDAFDDATRLELIAEAEREAEHLHQFSANLIHIARLEAGALDLRRKRVTLEELIDATLARACAALAPRQVSVAIPSGLRPLDVDPVLIEQALFQILENAGKYTPADATVSITVESTPDWVTLRIADSGPGFPLEDSERLFTKFYRANKEAEVAGTGLGLAICRGFIEAHGGTITAGNRGDGNGAVFTVILPA